ncbi:MAG: UDP-3-O-(3-hydroxymyristoyl)glucosamine N-acyltransferase [Candidatus Margulisiibacteriota bacterium]|nr:UDP-3-O-(3-hydroxymyristoyl)glucosamine N-acyltransferase [Candidatus Margulisiibacteriota bacterium]
MPQFKLKDLAKQALGEVSGDGEVVIKGVSPAEEAKSGCLVFVMEKRLLDQAINSKASAIVTACHSKTKDKPALLVKNPRLALAKILPLFAPKKAARREIHKTAVIPKSCKIGKEVYLGPFVVLGENVSIGNRTQVYPHSYIGDNSKIGSNCMVHSNVSIYANSIIGKNVVVHSGARIGVDGYGFVPQAEKHIKILQIGSVIIEDDVEIYANVCISRGTLGPTIIGAGTKIDSLTHIAHNCKIGKNCAIVSLVGFAGSVTLKDHVYVAGQAGFKGHNTIGENSIVMARAGVTKDFPSNSVISGFPAQEHGKEMEFQASLRRSAKKNK